MFKLLESKTFNTIWLVLVTLAVVVDVLLFHGGKISASLQQLLDNQNDISTVDAGVSDEGEGESEGEDKTTEIILLLQNNNY
jgi:hypothetical protein